MHLILSLFLFDIFWKRLHGNLFCSSPTLSQFPGRKRLIGSNVRQISVSFPLLPCVNALSSKNTASLCIYCIRRWVLSFFPLPLFNFFFNFWDIEILSAVVTFWDQWVGLVLARVRVSERESEMKESGVSRTVGAEFFLFFCCLFFFWFVLFFNSKETNACESWEEPVALCECERKKPVRVCSPCPSQGHLLHLEIPTVSFSHCFLSTLNL